MWLKSRLWQISSISRTVMAGLVPAIRVLRVIRFQIVDARDKRGHDEYFWSQASAPEEAGESRRAIEPVGETIGPGAARRTFARFPPLGHEAELGDDPRRGRVVGEMADREIIESIHLEGMDDKRAHRLARISPAPVGLADPVAELGVVAAEGAIAGAPDQGPRRRDPEHHALLSGERARDPFGGLLLAIGVRNGARHAGDVVVAGKKRDPLGISKLERPQKEPWRPDRHGGK